MRWRHALVVAVALLAISAQPVAAQNAPAVASSHTTFGTAANELAPTALENASVQGSGPSASISFDGVSETVSRPADDGTNGGTTGRRGLRINTNEPLDGLQATLSSNTTGVTTAYLLDSDTAVIESVPISGDTVRFSSTLAADTTYFVMADAGGNSYDSGQYLADAYPVTGDAVDITGTRYAGVNTTNLASNFVSISTLGPFEGDTGSYISAPHDAGRVASGWINLTLRNTSATVLWQEDADGDGAWTTVTSSTYTTDGNATADLSGATSDHWRVRVDFEATGPDPAAEIHDEGLLFSPKAPTLSDPEPPDEMQIQNATGNVSIAVSDSDFGLAQGDSVTVSATDGDGNSLGSTALTSNGTASLAYTSVAGENTIQWTASDNYGNTETFTQTFETPGVIEVRNESEPGTIISSASNITATFYGADGTTVVQKPSPNGTIPIAGVPTNTEYVVAVNANGYRPRRVRLTNLFDQQSVYLLPETANSANIQFELNDRTGNFPSDSELIISKPITENGSTAYVDIAADSFGATGSTRFILEDNSRYLLRVKSPNGDVREIGAYTTAGAAVEPIPIGRVSVGSTIDSGSALQTGYISENGQTYLRVTYADPDNRTESLTYKIVNETGAVIEPERTVSVTGEYRATIPVNSTDAATVNYSYTRQTEAGLVTTSGNASVGGLPGIARTWPIDQQVLSLSGYLLIVGVTGLLVIRDPGVASIAGTVVASLLTFIGVVAIPYMALGVAGVTAVLFNVGRVR